jgi:hypothetical protein
LDKDLYFVVYNCYPVETYTKEDQTWDCEYGHKDLKGSRSWLFNQIIKGMKHVDKDLRVYSIDQKVVHTWDEAKEAHADNLDKGHEGSMIKKINAACVLDRTVAFIKWKVYKLVDAIILGVTRGTGKYENSGGALIVYIPAVDDTAKCTARTAEIREWAWANREVISGFNVEVTADGSDDTVAKIRNPILKRFRHDVAPMSPREVVALCHRFDLPKPKSRITAVEYKKATASFIAE